MFWAAAAALAVYKLASSCALPMFFLYLIRLLPNQLETYSSIKIALTKTW
jgi:hypothetical protein